MVTWLIVVVVAVEEEGAAIGEGGREEWEQEYSVVKEVGSTNHLKYSGKTKYFLLKNGFNEKYFQKTLHIEPNVDFPLFFFVHFIYLPPRHFLFPLIYLFSLLLTVANVALIIISLFLTHFHSLYVKCVSPSHYIIAILNQQLSASHHVMPT